jgi:predicted nucleic acid-binding protein
VSDFVVDASVAIKWLPPFDKEPLAAEAQALLDGWQDGSIELMAPDLIWPEIANALWRSVRQNRCSVGEAEAALALMQDQDLPVVPSAPLIDFALKTALLYGRTAYDSLYVALAVRSKSDLITADEKLANALAGYLPVKWLGSF